MRITRGELEMIRNPRIRRRLMRLPALTNKAPGRRGQLLKLTCHGDTETVTIKAVYRQLLGVLTDKQAKAEGFHLVSSAQGAWREANGHYQPEQAVWVIEFLRGNQADSAIFHADDKEFLAPSGRGDYTSSGDVLRAGEVMKDPESEKRQVRAREELRRERDRRARSQLATAADTLRASLADMKERQRERDLAKRALRAIRIAENAYSEIEP